MQESPDVRISCPACGWVKPLHPYVSMRSCPCGWNETNEEIVVIVVTEVLQMEFDISSLATVSA